MGQMPSSLSCVGGTATPAGDKWGNPVYLGPVNVQWSWGVQCGQGVSGGTISNTSTSQSLYACAVSCDQDTSCVGAGYTGTQCVHYSDFAGASQMDAANTILLTTNKNWVTVVSNVPVSPSVSSSSSSISIPSIVATSSTSSSSTTLPAAVVLPTTTSLAVIAAPTTTSQAQTTTTTATTTTSQSATQILSAAQIDNTCTPGHYKASNYTYSIVCGATFYGGDLSSQPASTFDACIAACDSTPACVDVSYVGNMCYLKQTLTPLRSEQGTKTAVRSALINSIVTTNPTCNNGASDGLTYNTASDNSFTVTCGIDYMGGDLSAVYGVTYQACLEECGATTGCIAVSYRGTSCYMKNVLEPGVRDSGVWGAKLAASQIIS